jgi:hypothetical protein
MVAPVGTGRLGWDRRQIEPPTHRCVTCCLLSTALIFRGQFPQITERGPRNTIFASVFYGPYFEGERKNYPSMRALRNGPNSMAQAMRGVWRARDWRVTVNYRDKQSFSRVYTDREKAGKFADRQNEVATGEEYKRQASRLGLSSAHQSSEVCSFDLTSRCSR